MRDSLEGRRQRIGAQGMEAGSQLKTPRLCKRAALFGTIVLVLCAYEAELVGAVVARRASQQHASQSLGEQGRFSHAISADGVRADLAPREVRHRYALFQWLSGAADVIGILAALTAVWGCGMWYYWTLKSNVDERMRELGIAPPSN